MNVRESGTPVYLTASGIVLARGGVLLGIFVSSASATPTIKVWDNPSAGSGSILIDTFTPVAGTFYPMPVRFGSGCFVTIGGTVSLTAIVNA